MTRRPRYPRRDRTPNLKHWTEPHKIFWNFLNFDSLYATGVPKRCTPKAYPNKPQVREAQPGHTAAKRRHRLAGGEAPGKAPTRSRAPKGRHCACPPRRAPKAYPNKPQALPAPTAFMPLLILRSPRSSPRNKKGPGRNSQPRPNIQHRKTTVPIVALHPRKARQPSASADNRRSHNQ